MKNSILFIVLIASSFSVFGQNLELKDTLFFSKEGYSRAIALQKNRLIIGTSKSGLIAYDLNKKTTKTLIQPVSFGEIRDVIVDGKTIYACTSGDSGIVYQVKGKQVNEIFNEKCFIDDIVKKNNEIIILSDPVNNKFSVKVQFIKSGWTMTSQEEKMREGEAFYAASGTTAQLIDGMYFMVSGGPNNATFYRKSTFEYRTQIQSELPMPKAEGSGPFSLCMLDNLNGVIVGGNYTKPNNADSTSIFTNDGGKTWKVSDKCTNGYRSCVIGDETMLFACGTNGIDISTDMGKTWIQAFRGNFCAMIRNGNILYATTNKGYVLQFEIL